MSRSHFKFEREGTSVEISGESEFVERMCRRIMRDIDAVRPDDESIQSSQSIDAERPSPRDHVVWLVRFSDLMRRIYMAEARDLNETPVGAALDPKRIGTLYVGKETFTELFPRIHNREETLWAELTEAGRRRIAGTKG